MLKMSRSGPRKDRGKLRPGVRGAHVDNPNCLDAWFRRLDAKQGRGLLAFDAAPEFPLCGNDEMLIEWIGMGLDLNPFATPGDDRENGAPRRNDPHVVLQLGRVFFPPPLPPRTTTAA